MRACKAAVQWYLTGTLGPPCPKSSKVKGKSKEETTTPTDRVFQKSWLIDFEWLRYDGVAKKMHCEICRNAGSKLAGNTDFVAGSENFKRENVRIHGNSGRHRKCRDTAIAQQHDFSFLLFNSYNKLVQITGLRMDTKYIRLASIFFIYWPAASKFKMLLWALMSHSF